MPSPKKTKKPELDYDFVKKFIEVGLRQNRVTYEYNEMGKGDGYIGYILSSDGLYTFFAVVKGQFEAWARNQGGFEAALREGFKVSDLGDTKLSFGQPIWLRLAGPEDVVNFLSDRPYLLHAPKRKRKVLEKT